MTKFFYISIHCLWSLIFPIYSGFCIFGGNSLINNCFLCDKTSYHTNSFFVEPFDQSSCAAKVPELIVNSIVYISPIKKNCDIQLNCDGSLEKPYDNIIQAMTIENLRRMAEIQTSGSTIIFKFFIGTHYILAEDITSTHLNFFRRMPINIIFAPLYCNEVGNSSICNNNEKIVIISEIDYFSFFISKSMTMQKIIFNFSVFFLGKNLYRIGIFFYKNQEFPNSEILNTVSFK